MFVNDDPDEMMVSNFMRKAIDRAGELLRSTKQPRLAEAKALITQHRAAVRAIADALMIYRTLDSAQIDNIIATAPERARRADWRDVLTRAAEFTAVSEN